MPVLTRPSGTALGSRSKDGPELVPTPIPLTAQLDVLPVRGGDDLRSSGAASVVDEPLGYAVEAVRNPLFAPSHAASRGRNGQPGEWDLDSGSDPSEFISLVNEFGRLESLDRRPSRTPPPASLSGSSGSLLG